MQPSLTKRCDFIRVTKAWLEIPMCDVRLLQLLSHLLYDCPVCNQTNKLFYYSVLLYIVPNS